MQPVEFVAAYYYSTAWYCFFLLLSWSTTLYYIGSNTQKILYAESNPSQELAGVLTVIVSFFIGLRQITGDFGDTRGYANFYEEAVSTYEDVNLQTEWLWTNFCLFCKKVLGMNVHEFFLVVALLYFAGMFICCMVLMRKNLWLSMMFFFTAFSTYSYATNGLRNGLACSIVLVAISLLTEGKSRKILSVLLMLLAMCIHRSTLLPSAMAFASLYFIRDTKIALRFWCASIVLSLAMGSTFENFFASLGFDDRMDKYRLGQYQEGFEDKFSHTGFRWDFFLYSAFPVLMIWYVTQRRKFNNKEYAVVANTYLLCNAFWILVIRAAYSNRFAYLSWFIHPLVMVYPLLRMNIWRDQDRKTAIIFFLYSGFTFFMFFIFYFGTTGFKGFDQYWWR